MAGRTRPAEPVPAGPRIRPDLDVAASAAALFGGFADAARRTPVVESGRRFGDLTLRFRIAGPALHDALTAAFAHLPTVVTGEGADAPVDLDIVAWDSGTGQPSLIVADPAAGRDSLVDERGGVEVLAFEPSMTVLDTTSGRLGYWAESLAAVPVWQRASPFRTALHWWLAERGAQLVHAAAVAVSGAGLLIVGGSGSGKSTTALRCAHAGLGYAGDDYVVVEPETRVVRSLYSTGKADLARLRADPELLPEPLLPTLPQDDKAVTHLGRHRPELVVSAFNVVGLVVAEVRGSGATTVEPIGRGDALRAMAVTTLHQLPGDRAGALQRAAAVASALPCRRLVLGTDHDRIPGVVAGLIDDLSR